MAAPAAAIRASQVARVSRLARLRKGYQAWRARRAAAAATRRLNAAAKARARAQSKASILRSKTAVQAEKTKLAEQRALAKGYRKGTIKPGGRVAGEAAGTAPIAAAILGSSYIGAAGGVGQEAIDEAGDVLGELLGAEGTEIPAAPAEKASVDLRAELAAQRSAGHADRVLALKLARLDARTRVRLAREQRKMAREVAFLNNPVIGVGVAFSLGVGTLAGLHAITEMRDTSGNAYPWTNGVRTALTAVPTFTAPTLPTGFGSGGSSSFQIAPPTTGQP